jgi:SAM-dependent methyltransferase
MSAFHAAEYWEARYRDGGDSGAGSAGRLLDFKTMFVNAFIAENAIADVLDLGCGDGRLLSRLHVPRYIGVDVSATALACCVARFPQHRFVPYATLDALATADVAMSLDVIFDLVEDAEFARYMRTLFAHARRFVLIYASNTESNWPVPHVRHRRFTEHVAREEADWRLLAHVPNPYPFDPDAPDDTSFADFFVYARAGEPCHIAIPENKPLAAPRGGEVG